MSVRSLLDPILDQGILNTNFFEGRLLTAQDMRDQQDANRERARRLGRAIGQGVIEGLEVSVERDGSDGHVPVVTVKSGLALTGEGEIIGLPKQDVQVALSRTIDATPTTEADFYACAGPPTTKQLPNGAGVYILVMSPAAGYKDRAPKSGLGDAGVVKGCGRRYVQEGVRFRLVELKPATLGGISDATRTLLQDDLLSPTNPALKTDYARASKLRNVLAHLCFGTEELARFAQDPFAREAGRSRYLHYGAIDALRASGALDECDVPLALFYWTLDGIAFCDLWSVRRSPIAPSHSGECPTIVDERARIDAQSCLLQFQAQLASLLAEHPRPSEIRAMDYFRYLAPVGALIYDGPTGSAHFDYLKFFEPGIFRNPVFINGAAANSLAQSGLRYPPIELRERELVWIYVVRENGQANERTPTSTNRYMYFATGQMPFVGDARFNVSRWNYANYTSSGL